MENDWESASRGVATSADTGYFFSGPSAAYERVRRHLDDGAGLLVVTGSRGCGKSAILARAVVLSCRRYLTLLGADAGDVGNNVPPQPLDAAVSARGAPASVAAAIGEQLGLGPLPPERLAAAIAGERLCPSIVIDAVDESENPHRLMREIVLPLAQSGRVAVGALRRRIGSDVPSGAAWVDLEQNPYRDDSAIPSYVARRLMAARYDSTAADEVARAVAKAADGLFLIAELQTRTLTERAPITSRSGWEKLLASSVWEAFRDYLSRFGDERERVLALLHPLAHARGDGLSIEPGDAWLAAANNLRPRQLDLFTAADLRNLLNKASDYLLTRPDDGSTRLYHEGLAEAVRVLAARERLELGEREATPESIATEIDEATRCFSSALLDLLPKDVAAPAASYLNADPYLLRYLPIDLAGQARANELLERPGLLLAGDQAALGRALVRGALSIPPERERARVAVVHAVATPRLSASERAAALCVALRRQGQAQLAEQVKRAFAWGSEPATLPWELVSAPPLPPALATLPDAHEGGVSALAVVAFEREPLLVSGGADGAVRSWRLDGEPGPLSRNDAHQSYVLALAVAALEGEPLVVSGGRDGEVRSWRLDGEPGPLSRDDAHQDWVSALAVAAFEGEPLVVSGGRDGVRSWRLDGEPGPAQPRRRAPVRGDGSSGGRLRGGAARGQRRSRWGGAELAAGRRARPAEPQRRAPKRRVSAGGGRVRGGAARGQRRSRWRGAELAAGRRARPAQPRRRAPVRGVGAGGGRV